MADLLSLLNSSLPDEVTFDFDQFQTGNATFGKDSYFDVEVTDNSLLAGTYDAYCIDTDRFIDDSGTLTAKVYSTYETLPDELIGDQSTLPGAPAGFGNIEKPENFDLLNWILNQCFVGKELSDSGGNSLGTVTYGDIQRAIWELIDDENSTENLGPFDQDRADRIQELAEANGENFVPTFEYTTFFGEQVTGQVGVILIPDSDGFEDDSNDANPFDRQFMIIGVELAKLGDFVWDDLNANGIQDAGEEGIEGATVNLLADIDGDGEIENDEIVDTTTTDADGNYEFEVIAGDYKVEFETPDGFDMASPANQGSDDAEDSDGPISDEINLEGGEYDPTIDAGFFKKASLGDKVFFDTDGDGIQDPGEAGVEGVTVTLTGGGEDGVIGTGGDDTTETTTTDADGMYEFTNLNPGEEYKVTFEESTLPDGFEFTAQDQGSDDTVDSDADPANGMTQVVTLESGENNPTLDAGIVQQTASLGDKVFFDTDGDGIQDPGEAGVEGVTVTLTGGGEDGVIGTGGDDTTETTTTDTDGMYEFTNLNPGEEYKVTFSDLPDDFEFTAQDQGSDDTVDSDADPAN
ncbi:MAG: SdrD B-like domain-containing protein, partial [Cyanobacteriota bacterium]|nr:SdrD B-like domain-containing protein [Cyanobacteriota bacterium]